MNFQRVEFEEFMARQLTIVRNITTTPKFLITFECLRKLLSKVFKSGRFLVKDITRKLMSFLSSKIKRFFLS